MADSSEKIHQGWLSRLTTYSFLLLVTSLGFPQIPIPLFGQDVVLTDLLFLLTAGLWVSSIVSRGRRIRWHRFFWALLAYAIAMLISAILSAERLVSLRRFPAEAYLICLAVLTFNIVDSGRALKRTIIAWLVGTAIAVVVGIATVVIFYTEPQAWLLDYLTYHYGSVPVGNYPRITSGFVSASMLCNFLNVGFVLALLAYKENWIPRTMNIFLIFAVAAAAAFTISIGLGGFALALGICSLLFGRHQQPIQKIFFVVCCLIALLFLAVSPFALASYPGATVLIGVPFTEFALMPSARMLVWANSFQTFMSHPLTGLGLGLPVANVDFTNTEGSSSLLTDAHNCFLSVAAQNGMIGLAAFISIIVVILRRWWREVSAGRSLSTFGALGLAFICSFVYQGLTGSFEDARHLWVLIGMLCAAENVATSRVQNS